MSTASDTEVGVSVIIPAYNMAEYIGGAIRSVLNGDFEKLEVIVIDDGSEDSTRSVIAEYVEPSRSKYDVRVRYERQDNSGKAVAVNRGVEISRGEYITILDADDQLTPTSLSSRYSALEDRGKSSHDLAVGGFEVLSHDGATIGHRPISSDYTLNRVYETFYLSYKSPFHLNACLFSRDLFRRVGPFDTRLRRCQDIDYSLRLLKAAEEIVWVHKPVYRYRKHRSDCIERIRVRGKTLTYRPLVYWKNYEGWRRYMAVFTGTLLDTGKLVYELTGNYTN